MMMRLQAVVLLCALSAISADLPYTTVTWPGNASGNSAITIPFTHAGLRFQNTTGTNVTITQLGRWVLAGNSQEHTLYLYDDDANVMGSVVIDCDGATTNQFLWGALPTATNLSPGQIVYVMSTESVAGDIFKYAYGGGGTNDQQVDVEDIGLCQEATYDGVSFDFYGVPTSTGWTHGPVNFQYSFPTRTWTKSGTTYTTDGTYYQMTSALADASVGDTVMVPAGTNTWGTGATKLVIPAGVILSGAGKASTIINIAPDATPGFTETMITLNSGSQLKSMSFYGSTNAGANGNLFKATSVEGWRVSDIGYYQASGQNGYFAFLQYTTSGLFDNCTIQGGAGNAELIFHRGAGDSWQTAHSLGTTNNIIVEDCTFSGSGYVCDANSNSRMVVRNCTITGNIKVDGHGKASNTPARGVRHMEVYNNTWSYNGDFWAAIEIRGGSGMVFSNRTINATVDKSWFFLTDYGYTAQWVNFTNTYQTPVNYPVDDQIGVGIDPKAAASEPMYLWNNLGAATMNAGTATVDWTLTWKEIPAGAIALYTNQTGNTSSTFHMTNVIQADIDYFKHTAGASFDGSTGVGIGTKAQMLAITATKTNVGYWVTDEADWNKNSAGNDGQLYTWSGSAWVLKYTPLEYPHPMRNGDRRRKAHLQGNGTVLRGMRIN